MAYIEERNSDSGCLFCLRLAETDGPDNLILHRGRKAFVILNRFPYTNGHLMIVPNEHQPSLERLDQQTLMELMELSTRALRSLRRAYGAEAFNLGVNIGAVAGAGVVDHVHMHVVPRWAGDTNFMATIAEARVIPEDLSTTYRRLSEAWQAV